jgi:hypothetical protein
MNFNLEGRTYQFEIHRNSRGTFYIDLVAKNAFYADVYYTATLMSPESEHFDNAIINGRIKLQYEDNDCICVICLYEYKNNLGLKKDTFKLQATCAGPKELFRKQKAYIAEINAIRCEIDNIKREIAALKAK